MLQPTTPEQREGIYEDVLKLLIPGFLTATVSVADVSLCVRSLNPGDLFLLQARTDNLTEKEWRAWFIAGATWMVNGEVILGHPSAATTIYRTLISCPSSVLRPLFYQCFGLIRRVHEAAERAEAFCYERSSRYLWKQVGTDFASSGGIPGLEKIGTNAIQRVWTAMNSLEDERLATLQAWECSKLVASTQAYKSVKRMSQSERTHLDQETQRRQEVMDRAYWKSRGFLVDETEVKEHSLMLHTKSADELMDEYKRWVAGEQDWHDEVVAEYKAKIKRAMQQEAERIQRLNDEYDQEIRELGLPESAPGIVGYTPEQVQEILQRAHRPGQMRGARHVRNDDKKFKNYERFLRPKEVPSNLSFNDLFQSKSDGPTLDEQIANRQVKLDPRERE